MQVLAINCGSASLKFSIWEQPRAAGEKKRAEGSIAWSGQGPAEIRLIDGAGTGLRRSEAVVDHAQAIERVVSWLRTVGQLAGVEAVGHRIVHGGPHFDRRVRIDQTVLEEIERVSELAPLHNPGALRAVGRTRELLGERLPMVAVFDTAFHRTIPPRAQLYPLDWNMSERMGLRRYGFHGIAHQYLAEAGARLTGRPLDELRLITLQLGNGCSAAAVAHGRSIDTSMGFTPLEGLMMGTRCGDADPGLILYVLRKAGRDVKEIERLLNEQCGLLGVSQRSRDMRDLLEAEAAGDDRSALAIEMFCYRIRKYIGAYLAVLGGADVITFGGGIGENASEIRRRICEGMRWAGLSLDAGRNSAAVGVEARISAEDSTIAAYTVTVQEELLIARETFACVGEGA